MTAETEAPIDNEEGASLLQVESKSRSHRADLILHEKGGKGVLFA